MAAKSRNVNEKGVRTAISDALKDARTVDVSFSELGRSTRLDVIRIMHECLVKLSGDEPDKLLLAYLELAKPRSGARLDLDVVGNRREVAVAVRDDLLKPLKNIEKI